MQPLIDLQNIDVALDGTTVLRDLTWQLRAGEHWAICGGNGSGKSTFLRLLRGDVSPVPKKGRRIFRLGGIQQSTAVGLRQRVALVSPELQDRYLQQEWRLTGLQVVHSGFRNGDYVYEKPTSAEKQFAAGIVQLLGIGHLLARNIQQLSTGELRKLLIARALAGKPEILALDEACDGLDAPARADLQETLESVARIGTQLLLATHRSEEMLSCITHILELEGGRVVESMNVRPTAHCDREDRTSLKWPSVPPLASSTNDGTDRVRSERATPARAGTRNHRPARTLVRIENANVFLERKRVLREIHWEIRDDQHWAVVGRNGSGKSTLLKLAFGDLYAAWGAKVSRFEFTAKNTIWDLKCKIGYVAPDLQANYRESINGADVIASGFFATFGVHRRPSRVQWRKVHELINDFQLIGLAHKGALRMSYGEFRKMLLLRALVNEPDLLLCDEPFDGLDPRARADFGCTLESVARNGTRLVVVTHHPADLPKCITHALLLEDGRIIVRGPLAEVRAHPAAQRLFA